MTLQVNNTSVNEVYLNRNVGYTIVGNPTIIDGIVSDFTANDYVKTILPSSIQKLEFNTVLTISNTNWQSLFDFGCDAYINGGNGQCVFRYTNTLNQTSYEFVGSISTNIPISFNIHINNNFLVLNIIQNEQTIYSNTVNDFLISSLKSNLTFSGYDPLSGTLNLNETYIKTNDITWFNGKQQASPAVNEVYLNRNVGYTIVDGGNIQIVDGVVSGFSINDYLKLNSLFPGINNSDMDVFITLKSAGIGAGKGYRSVLSGVSGIRIALTSSSTPTFTVYTKKSGESTYTARSIYNYSAQVDSNNNFYLHFTKNGNVLSIQGANNDGVFKTASTYTLEEGEEIALDSNYPEIMHSGPWGDIENSAIDLNSTYIKVSGVTWFNGKQTATTPVWTRSI